MMDRKLSPNNLSKNDLNRARGTLTAFGRYQNVFLTQDEYTELQQEIPGLDRLVEELSGYIRSDGKHYADHAAVLRRWHNRERPQQGIPEYSCKEGESL